jgi:hypothetical protein
MAGMHLPVPRARSERLVVQDLEDELLVYDLDRHRAHSLNATAALVWRHCDGRTSVGEVATLLERELGLPPNEDVVWLALRRLQAAHLLRDRLALAEGADTARRTLVRRLGLAGGLAMLLPVVESIVAPTPAYAQTPVQNCTPGTQCAICRRNLQEIGKCCNSVCRDDVAARNVCNCPL